METRCESGFIGHNPIKPIIPHINARARSEAKRPEKRLEKIIDNFPLNCLIAVYFERR